jgi:hypothetical protein
MQPLALESLALHLQHAAEIARLSGTAPGVRRVSRLLIAGDDAELRALAVRRELAQATPGFAARWVTTAELARIEPALGSERAGTPPTADTRWIGRAGDGWALSELVA